MSIFLRPSELELIRGDFIDLLNGLDSVDITLTWKVGGGAADPVYPHRPRIGETTQTEVVRGMVVCPVAGLLLFRNRDITKGRNEELSVLDAIFMISSSVNITGRRDLTFTVASFGTFAMAIDPPLAMAQYILMLPDNASFVQWCFARALA